MHTLYHHVPYTTACQITVHVPISTALFPALRSIFLAESVEMSLLYYTWILEVDSFRELAMVACGATAVWVDS